MKKPSLWVLAALAAVLKADAVKATEVSGTQQDPISYNGLCGLTPEEKTARRREMGRTGSRHL